MSPKKTPPQASESGRTHGELERLLTMIPYLYENGRVPVEEVAARFGLSLEEVVEAIDRIAILGDEVLEPHQLIDAYIEEGHVGIDVPPAVRRPIRLTARQALSLIVGADFLRAEGLTISPALARAVEKVRGATSRGDREQLGELERLIAFAHEGDGLSDIFRRLETARAAKESLEIEYLSGSGSGFTRRKIDPYLLWNQTGFWYCAAYCRLREETRTFRVSRIRSARPMGERFDVASDFDASKYGTAPVYVPPKDALQVRVRFAPDVARYVEERSPGEIVERARDGAITVLVTAGSLTWLLTWLLPYGSSATLLDPPAAREAMRNHCQEVLEQYEQVG